MARLIVPQEDEQEVGAAQSETVELALARQRQRDTVQSLISSMILVGLLIGVLALITILSLRTESPTIVTYQAPVPEEERVERPEGIAPALQSAIQATHDGQAALIEFITREEPDMATV